MPTTRGIKGTYEAIRSANGPAQHVAFSIVGVTYAGMFAGMVPEVILWAWAWASLLVLVATVWLRPEWLKRALLLDFTLSFLVLSFYFLHDVAPQHPVYHVMTADGMRSVTRNAHDTSALNFLSHSIACSMMAVWSLYLANLVHRQILEAERFEVVFEGESLK